MGFEYGDMRSTRKGSVREQLRVSDEMYEDMIDASDHACWICGAAESIEGRRLAVDHDHRTGAVRGLLCTRCNRRLGGTVDSEWLRRAAEYLEVAARAFGDNCAECGSQSPSMLISSDGHRSVFGHSCCGRRWRVSYVTGGYPVSWAMSGVPVPAKREPLRPPEGVGHPGPFRG